VHKFSGTPCIQLPNAYNINCTTYLITGLQSVNIKQNTTLCPFDTSKMYTNIPKPTMSNTKDEVPKKEPSHLNGKHTRNDKNNQDNI
jgi:hypothetical protein